MSVISEGLECFGGLGYMENSGLPRILRDAQVTPIWEGTTSTLSLDFVHSIFKKPEAYIQLFKHLFTADSAGAPAAPSHPSRSKVLTFYGNKYMSDINSLLQSKNRNLIELNARTLMFNFGLLYILSLFEKRVIPKYGTDEGEMAVI